MIKAVEFTCLSFFSTRTTLHVEQEEKIMAAANRIGLSAKNRGTGRVRREEEVEDQVGEAGVQLVCALNCAEKVESKERVKQRRWNGDKAEEDLVNREATNMRRMLSLE